MWQVRLRTAISVYFTLLRTYCGDVYNSTTVPGKLRASPGRPLDVATPVPRQSTETSDLLVTDDVVVVYDVTPSSTLV